MNEHVLLIGHGTVEDLDDLAPFLDKIRRGRPTPPELLAEVRRRYEAIGGRSPLLTISRAQAAALSKKRATPVHVAMRLWRPFVKDVFAEIIRQGCTDLRVVALAPYSASVYTSEVGRLAAEAKSRGEAVPRLFAAGNWGLAPSLVRGFAGVLEQALLCLDEARRARAHVLFTAHSLPLFVVRSGDRYADEVAATAAAVVAACALSNPHRVAFQSQGMTSEPWLGPDLREAFAAIVSEGGSDVVVCPIGFLTDHVEILYDLDIEARTIARELGLSMTRTESLNASPALTNALSEAVDAAVPLSHEA